MTAQTRGRAYGAVGVILAGGFLLMLAANMPGQLSLDSVMQLYEGRFQVRETFAPAIYSLVLRIFDSILPGTALYLLASGLLLFGALAALRGLRPRVSWLAVPVALAIVLTPQLLVYQGIVWRDVMFANVSVAGFVCLAYAVSRWERRGLRWAALAGALFLLALAAVVRQNGLIVVLLAAIALAWTARVRWFGKAAYGVGFFVAAALLSQGLNGAAQPKTAGRDTAMDVGLRILQHYDVVAAAALDPSLPLSEIDKVRPADDDFIRAEARKVYSPERVDFFDRSPDLGKHLWPVPAEAMRAAWLDVIFEHPDLYLRHRLGAFTWVFLTPEVGRCVPLHVGVEGPPEKIAALKLAPGADPQDMAVYRYAERFFQTPVYSHLTYAVIAVAVAGLLLLRRDPADMAIVALMLGALGFTASFFVISLACDYRYLYFLDLAALTGLLYLAIDPPFGASRRRAAET
jgi:hypothetical protein